MDLLPIQVHVIQLPLDGGQVVAQPPHLSLLALHRLFLKKGGFMFKVFLLALHRLFLRGGFMLLHYILDLFNYHY